MVRPIVLCALLVACNKDDDDKPETGERTPEGLVTLDLDGDGVKGDADCNDTDPTISPDAAEVCNGVDDNCDGEIDEGLFATYYRDADADGFGDKDAPAEACHIPTGFVDNNTDCDDTADWISPAADETCDLEGLDEDCDGLANEEDDSLVDIRTWYEDTDGDGYGDPDAQVLSCFGGLGLTVSGTDCDDTRSGISPGLPEQCDPADVDEDCDGLADELDPEGPDGHVRWFIDNDGDLDGDASDPGQFFCDGVPEGYVTQAADCDDTDAAISPTIPEHCADSVDNDCNGLVDDCGPIADIPADTADVILDGQNTYDYIGYSVADLGDVNGDGIGDFGSSSYSINSWLGGAFINYGPMSSLVDAAADAAGATIEGNAEFSYIGASIEGAGDLDGDGYDDVAIGGYYYPGALYIFSGPLVGTTNPDDAEAIWLEEQDYSYVGFSIDGGFDFNADGEGDFIIGAPYWDASSYASEGAAYVLLGPVNRDGDLADAPRVEGDTTYAYLGQGVSSLGDVDGDGFDDLGVGAYGASSSRGEVYVFYGRSSGFPTGEAASVSDVTLEGANPSDYFGFELAPAGDHDLDGYDDFVVSARYTDTGTSNTGSVFVVTGGPAGIPSGPIASVAVAEHYGQDLSEGAGSKIDGSKDLNQDGFNDLLVGSSYRAQSGTYSAGAVYVVLGPSAGVTPLANARCEITGSVGGEQVGFDVNFIGDQDGDGTPEVFFGSPYGTSTSGSTYVGQARMMLGSRF